MGRKRTYTTIMKQPEPVTYYTTIMKQPEPVTYPEAGFPTDGPVMVSICAVCFQHAPYLRQALNGFLTQKCPFRVEILVHDDASTDGSGDILREYAARYPNIVKPMIQTENQTFRGRRENISR